MKAKLVRGKGEGKKAGERRTRRGFAVLALLVAAVAVRSIPIRTRRVRVADSGPSLTGPAVPTSPFGPVRGGGATRATRTTRAAPLTTTAIRPAPVARPGPAPPALVVSVVVALAAVVGRTVECLERLEGVCSPVALLLEARVPTANGLRAARAARVAAAATAVSVRVAPSPSPSATSIIPTATSFCLPIERLRIEKNKFHLELFHLLFNP